MKNSCTITIIDLVVHGPIYIRISAPSIVFITRFMYGFMLRIYIYILYLDYFAHLIKQNFARRFLYTCTMIYVDFTVI